MRRLACVIATKEHGGIRYLFKIRDRNYKPDTRLVREIRNGVEVLYYEDLVTGWVEGLNEYGVGIVNSALAVKSDENAAKHARRRSGPVKSKDRAIVLKALEQKTLKDARDILLNYRNGIRGHVIVGDGKSAYAIENTSKHDPFSKKLNGEGFVRTNHGIEHPDAGYTQGDNRDSSLSRLEAVEKLIVDPLLLPVTVWELSQKEKDRKMTPVRDTDNMSTCSSVLMDLTNRKLNFYLVPSKLSYLGVEDKLPKNHSSSIQYEVFSFERAPKGFKEEVTVLKLASQRVVQRYLRNKLSM